MHNYNYFNRQSDELKLHWSMSPFEKINNNEFMNRYTNNDYDKVTYLELSTDNLFDERLYKILLDAYTIIGFDYLVDSRMDILENRLELKRMDNYNYNLMYLKYILHENVIKYIKSNNVNGSKIYNDNLSVLTGKYSKVFFEEVYSILYELKEVIESINNTNNTISKVKNIRSIKEKVKFIQKGRHNSLLDSFTLSKMIVDIFSQTISIIESTEFNEKFSKKYIEIKAILVANICYLSTARSINEEIKSFEDFIKKFDLITLKEQEIIQKIIINKRSGGYRKQLNISIDLNEFLEIFLKSNIDKSRYVYGNSCFAIMNYNSEKFFSLSGIDCDKTNISTGVENICSTIEMTGYNRVFTNDEMRIYFTLNGSNDFITYSEFIKRYKSQCDLKVSTLFSCCERKLLTALDNDRCLSIKLS